MDDMWFAHIEEIVDKKYRLTRNEPGTEPFGSRLVMFVCDNMDAVAMIDFIESEIGVIIYREPKYSAVFDMNDPTSISEFNRVLGSL